MTPLDMKVLINIVATLEVSLAVFYNETYSCCKIQPFILLLHADQEK